MKKILYIATTANSRNRLDGETIKCRLLKDYLEQIDPIKLISIDTDHWQKHILKLIVWIVAASVWCDKIIVSSADRGAHIVLRFFQKIRLKKEIYYFVIGGALYNNIVEKKWKIASYKNIRKIYVESIILKDNLESLGLKNVQQLPNFRRVRKFEFQYQKTEYVKFVFYGRVIKEKGIENAIRLIRELNENNISCTLDIYGPCTDHYLEELRKNFRDTIQYHGEIQPNGQTEYEILSRYDVFLFPTEYPGECLPGALIDSYIAGLAVVASNWKYAKEYILENENGVLFEYKNYSDLYQKTKEMIESLKIPQFKKKSLELSKKYRIEEILSDFQNLIME